MISNIKELRIGNWINGFYSDYSEEEEVEKSEFCKVLSLDSVDAMEYPIWVEGKSASVEVYSSFEPIELSEEILLKCGFKEEINSSMVKFWKINNFTIYHEYYKHSVVDDLEWFFLSNTEFNRLRIYSLHQLQNLYFALTNEELTIDLKQD